MFPFRGFTRLTCASRIFAVCSKGLPIFHIARASHTPFLQRALAHVPPTLEPYVRLARYNSPTGTWLLYLPCTWAIALAATPGCFPDFSLLALFGLGSILMRGAGCTINDYLDRNYDRYVTRTKDRPLASGTVSVTNAFLFLSLQMSAALVVLLQLNWYSVVLGAISIIPVTIYPLFKRFTYLPHLALGLTLNWGAWLGYSAVTGSCYAPVCVPLYMGATFWTLIYDTVYGSQDMQDDRICGVKSANIVFGDKTKFCLSLFHGCMLTSLLMVGVHSGAGWIYYGATVLTMFHNGYLLYTAKLGDPVTCWNLFKSGKTTGLIYFTGIVLDKLLTASPF
ncbi:unnamed protein product [Calicophoron daubneyi]|uniref:4-hydroxybenzoate polyprenyltransferase, mitochondrial n=1 Tax=Calicophoron daubneyi TaxID=300641 RepID=A0AAV2TBN1_CALDB